MTAEVLQGVKVADFSVTATGPICTRELAQHGATVVRVECHRKMDVLRTAPPFKDFLAHPDYSGLAAVYNTNKYGITLDLNTSKGPGVAHKLVKWADVVVESMTPGVTKRWGLDYESCRKIKPDIIYLSTCQYGQYGPYAKLPGYGLLSTGMAGFPEVTGWPDRGPAFLSNNYSDYIATWYAAIAIVLGLLHRRVSGEGMYIDQAQIESALTLLGPALLDYAANGRAVGRVGNSDPNMAPHGAYPCRGEDAWVVIAVATESEWQGFSSVVGMPWTKDERFLTFVSRKENEAELDKLTGAWTVNHTPEAVMTAMQAAGVPAGIVSKGEDLFKDPQLKHREHFRYLQHTCMGRHAYHSPAYKLSETPSRLWKAGPCLGEDNLYVYKEILGLSDDEISDLMAEGVITTEADIPRTESK